ncbi:hypothetical protein D3C87_1509600 [compost metagenome]
MLDGFHQHRAVADQLVATAGAGMMNRPGNRINLTTLFRRQPRGDQRTAGDTRLHYQYAERQTADDPVAPREVAGAGAGVQRELGNHRAARRNHGLGQPSIALWIKLFKSRAKYPDRSPAHIHRRLMRSGINSESQAAGDDKTGARQAPGKRGGGVHARSGSTPAADHRQLRFFQNTRIARHK